MIKEAQKAVYEFHKTFNFPISEVPKLMEESRVRIRAKWMIEEIDEFINATDIVEQTDAVIDLIYFALGILVEMGVEGDEIFCTVHQANMTKMRNDGVVTFNEEGKVLKPDGWVSPKELIKQIISQKFNLNKLDQNQK